MAEEKLTPEKVNKEYEAGILFNVGIDLYECVKQNENFFIGKQWEGVRSNGLPTPVFNFMKRVVLFSVANVSTDNLKLHAKPLPGANVKTNVLEAFSDILNNEFESIFDYNKMGGLIREFCRNSAVDGDGCMYAYWDPDVEAGFGAKGVIRTEVLQNTQVIFGNPNNRDVQSQPYILIERRMMVSEAKKYAKANKVSKDKIDNITSDAKQNGNIEMDTLGGEKVTVIMRLWKDEESGNIHCYECTRDVEIRKEWDIGISLYPLVWMPWDFVQDCYHGQAMITGLIPNQIFINKLYAMSMISLMTLAYPKVVYDKTRISKWSAKVGSAIGVNGNVEGVAKLIDPAAISPQISEFIQMAVSDTQKFLGASDVALGDTRPDNTSAIIALQRAAQTPMELTKQGLLQSVEQMGRIYMEYMAEYYGERVVEITIPNTQEKTPINFDFSNLKDIPCRIGLDAGASSYWSEIASMQTLDNLLMNGHISVSEYLKRLPAGQMTDREALIAITQQQEQMQMAMAGMPVAGPTDAAPPEGEMTQTEIHGGSGYGTLQRKINQTGSVPEGEV